MINPHDITCFDRNTRELQEFWIFCIMVAGKSSEQTAVKLRKMMDAMPDEAWPLNHMSFIGIRNFLVAHRVGQYNRISQAIEESINLDLRTATLDELMAIHGVGPKTARFFLLHSRRGVRVAVLDTHILKWMREYGVPNVPDSTPSGNLYLELEQKFLNICNQMFTGVPIAEVDLAIWSKYSQKS